MLTPSEEVTKTWVKQKGILIKSRPTPSRFSFAVCLAMVFSIAFGFLGGFITAGFSLSENYSSVYENLLAELETSRRCMEREKQILVSMKAAQAAQAEEITAKAPVKATEISRNTAGQSQAIQSVFNHAVQLLLNNDKIGGCAELKNIINLNQNLEWSRKAEHLATKNCS